MMYFQFIIISGLQFFEELVLSLSKFRKAFHVKSAFIIFVSFRGSENANGLV